MNADHYADMIRYAEALWPGTRNYRAATEPRLIQRFFDVDHRDAITAIDHLNAADPKHAPRIGEIQQAALAIKHQRQGADPLTSDCNLRGHHGPLAILSDIDIDNFVWNSAGHAVGTPAGHRRAICVDCNAELTKPADMLLTEGEREARRRDQAPPDQPSRQAFGDRSDRIAP